MAKRATKQFTCQECGGTQSKWSGRCPICGAWNSLIEESVAPLRVGGAPVGSKLTTSKLDKPTASGSEARLLSQIEEFDRVLGGGLVPSSVALVAGEPGIGKSTLLLKVAEAISTKQPVLYVSGEESAAQISARAHRLGLNSAGLELAISTNADDVAATISSGSYKLVVVDSIQTMATGGVSSGAGSISQVTASTQLLLSAAKNSQTAVILTGHVTKEGNIAGPRLLEHIVDVVMHLEGEKFSNFKLLRGIKNRFGSTDEVGIFAMSASGMEEVKNPSAAFLAERQAGDGSAVLATLEGSRALLVEVQALVSPSSFGYPKRTAAGFDLNRLNLLLAVLSQRAGLRLGTYDVYVNIAGGIKVNEPAADLAVAMAIASAARSKALAPGSVVFGEVGLNGEVRKVNDAEKRIKEARKLGFAKAIAPLGGGANSVHDLRQALKIGLKK